MIPHAKPRVRPFRPSTLEMRETADNGSHQAFFLSCVKRLRGRRPRLSLATLSVDLSGFAGNRLPCDQAASQLMGWSAAEL